MLKIAHPGSISAKFHTLAPPNTNSKTVKIDADVLGVSVSLVGKQHGQ